MFLSCTDKPLDCVDFVCMALDFVLSHNSFRFGNQWYAQRVGTAMGTPVAPTFANLFLAAWEEKYIYNINNPYIRYIKLWSRFIDDILIVWGGSEQQVGEFLEYINKNTLNMEFMGNYGEKEVQFLDVQLSVGKDRIVSKGFRKSTATNALTL